MFEASGGAVLGLVTDSSSQITAAIVERFDVEVVPMTVTIGGVEYHEGHDLDADQFYEHFADGSHPEITTSQPSPGRFVAAYQRLIDRGCTEIVSIHIAEAMSGTLASASMAATEVGVPVHVIDTGSASFGVAVCVWAAGVAIGRGGLPDDIRRRVEHLVPTDRHGVHGRGSAVDRAWWTGSQRRVRRGRHPGAVDVQRRARGTRSCDDDRGHDRRDVDVRRRMGRRVTVAIGTSDPSSDRLAERLQVALSGLTGVDEIVDYRIGPSVGAHTGPGTFGLFVFPTIK